MTIEIFTAKKDQAETLVAQLLDEYLNIDADIAKELYKESIQPLISRLRDEVFLLAETNYVDKVYRDSFYHYYSSKLSKYQRNCIRISLFNREIGQSDFRSAEGHEKLRNSYLGFFVLRPTDPSILGRNLISPKAFKDVDFVCAVANYTTTTNGLKLSVEGFPHSSQDTETITCAETTIWAIMEYFSQKYSDYSPVLPSKIIQTLNKVSAERQIPSKGLNIQQMSFALREFGLGTRIYSKDEYASEFNSLLSYYVESGIPLIIAMDDEDQDIGHALLCIGRQDIKTSKVDALNLSAIEDEDISKIADIAGIEILDFAGLERSYVFVDDNHSVYQTARLDAPALHYGSSWHKCALSFFIVPLYQKIYLEAYQAKSFLLEFLLTGPQKLANNTKSVIRLFLASSRTFKYHVALNVSLNETVKDLIVETPMPKFVWVAELTTKELLKKESADGLIILDATEANIYFNKPLIMSAYQGNLVLMDSESKKLENFLIDLGTFSIFKGNLKSFI